MKKLLTGIVFTLSMTGLALACGGMTQIDPPSMQLNAGPATTEIDSAVDALQGICILA